MTQDLDELFPQHCRFKVIASDATDVRVCIENTLRDLGIDVDLERGRRSAAGRFITLEFEATVDDAETLRGVVASLGRVQGVKMVL